MVLTTPVEEAQRKKNEETLALLAEQQAHPYAAPEREPGDVHPQDVLARGDTPEMPLPMIVSSVQSAGYSTIYDAKTGEPSTTNNNMLQMQLRKLGPDGKIMFVLNPPPKKPERVRLKCLLHENRPERAEFDKLGFPVCNCDTIPDPYQLDLHMRRKHTLQWEAIEKARVEREHEEDRKLQRAILAQAGRVK